MCRKALADEKRQHSGSHFAHFDFTRRVTHDGSARADILCHDAACADCRAFSNRYSGQDRCSSTEKNVVFDNDGSVDGLHVPKSAEVWWHRVITSYVTSPLRTQRSPIPPCGPIVVCLPMRARALIFAVLSTDLQNPMAHLTRRALALLLHEGNFVANVAYTNHQNIHDLAFMSLLSLGSS